MAKEKSEESLKALLDSRIKIYEEIASKTISIDNKSVAEIVSLIQEAFKEMGK